MPCVYAHEDVSSGSYELFCASRQLHNECRDLLYAKTPFVLHVSRFHLLGSRNIAGIGLSRSLKLTQDEVAAV